MGGSNSKQTSIIPTTTTTSSPGSQLEKVAYVDLAAAEKREAELAAQIEQTRQQAEAQIAAISAQLSGALTSRTYYRYFGIFLIVGIVVVGGILVYDYFAIKNGSTPIILRSLVNNTPTMVEKILTRIPGDLLPNSPHDGSNSATVTIPDTSNGSEFSYQFWIFIDGDKNAGSDGNVLFKRTDPAGTVANPTVYMSNSSSGNELSISIEFNKAANSNQTSPYTVIIQQLKVSKWVSVGINVFEGNIETYIDGLNVNTSIYQGTLKPALGNLLITPNKNFKGKLCNLKFSPKRISTADVKYFHESGPPCT
jgi:hypothetical protein